MEDDNLKLEVDVSALQSVCSLLSIDHATDKCKHHLQKLSVQARLNQITDFTTIFM